MLVQETPCSDAIWRFNMAASDGDPKLAPVVTGSLSLGSLSHSHLNQVLRNILGCLQSASQITTADGCLSIDLLKHRDPAFAAACVDGLLWEILDAQMCIEEPDACTVLQAALNSKNAVYMVEHEMQVLSQMSVICHKASAMADQFSYEAVRRRLLETMPTLADDPDLKAVFGFVIDMGSEDAPFLADLRQFHKLFVDPKVAPSSSFSMSLLGPFMRSLTETALLLQTPVLQYYL